MENGEGSCPLSSLCERLGTSISSCNKAAVPKYVSLEEARHKYGGDAELARLSMIEEDVDRLRACMTTVLKLLARLSLSSPNP
jgi:hypothetical protein